jgi:hypothetical protein
MVARACELRNVCTILVAALHQRRLSHLGFERVDPQGFPKRTAEEGEVVAGISPLNLTGILSKRLRVLVRWGVLNRSDGIGRIDYDTGRF